MFIMIVWGIVLHVSETLGIVDNDTAWLPDNDSDVLQPDNSVALSTQPKTQRTSQQQQWQTVVQLFD